MFFLYIFVNLLLESFSRAIYCFHNLKILEHSHFYVKDKSQEFRQSIFSENDSIGKILDLAYFHSSPF